MGRIENEIIEAADVYQELRDKFERLIVTGQGAQELCKVNQFHNDMAEIDRMKNVISKCKVMGCTMDDYVNRVNW
jgi:hypothetical protein